MDGGGKAQYFPCFGYCHAFYHSIWFILWSGDKNMNTPENAEHSKKVRSLKRLMYLCVIVLIEIFYVSIFICSLPSTVLLGVFIIGLLGLMWKHKKILGIGQIKGTGVI